MSVHELRILAETANGYIFACECGARGEPDTDRQSSLDAYDDHVNAQPGNSRKLPTQPLLRGARRSCDKNASGR